LTRKLSCLGKCFSRHPKEHTSVFSGNITIGSQSSNIFTINNRQIYVDEYGNKK
jgi:hypothetical protein